MLKVCLIVKKIKDNNFSTDGEKVDFLIFKTLIDLGYLVDIYCTSNKLTENYPINNIVILDKKYFYQSAFAIAEKFTYDLSFSMDYATTDVVYLHKHSRIYKETCCKSMLKRIVGRILKYKKYKKHKKEINRQKNILKKSKIIFTPSMALKNDLINLMQIDGQKIYILPPAINTNISPPIINNETFTFGFIANDFLEKGGNILLQAIAKLKRRNFKIKLACSKIPKFWKFYLKIFNCEDKIEPLPFKQNMDDFLSKIDCLIMPSVNETFGLAALNAMSMGKIVLISSRCGVKDIIRQADNGFIFDITKSSVKNLSDSMQEILINKDNFELVSKSAIATAQEYSYDKFKDELSRVLTKYTETKTGD